MRSLGIPGRRLACSALFLLLGICTAPANAQTTSTEILGLVTDSSGSVVPGAKVTITRVATGEKRTVETNAAGEYSFPLIEIGDYNVHVTMQGFKAQTVTGLHVELQQKARVNVTLEVGQVTDSVEVSAQAIALKTEDASVGQVIENKRIVELPLNGRNMGQLAVLVPGVQYGVRTGMADGMSGYPIPGTGMSIIANGIRELHNTISLDGVDAKNPRVHITVFAPSIEAIEEFKVQSGSYSAEYGIGAGGIINVSMKSGTNRLHGTVFEFLRNEKLDAKTYFLNFQVPAGSALKAKDRLRRNQFGAVMSGPVVIPKIYNGRNRTFWAFDFEGRRQNVESVSTAWFPNQAFRSGDLSALLSPATNPATGAPYRRPIQVYDPLTGIPIPGNLIPSSRLSPGAQNLIKSFLPQPQFQPADVLDFSYQAAVPQILNDNQYFWRVDHIFSDANRVFVRDAIDRARVDQMSVNPNFPVFTTSKARNLASQWIHTFNPTTLNEFRLGLNVADDDVFNPRTNTDFNPNTLGIGQYTIPGAGNRSLTPRETGVPLMGFTIGDGDTGNGWDRMQTWQFADNLALVRGKHAFKMGMELRYEHMDRAAANTPRGNMSFSATESGYDFASLLLGYPNVAATPQGLPLTLPRAKLWGAYFLDEWKVTPRLTVNAGLRWDYYREPIDAGGYTRNLSFARLYTMPDGTTIPTIFPEKMDSNGYSGGAIPMWNQEGGFFLPRLGLAYRPASKWAIRAGAGRYASPIHLNVFTPLNLAPPLSGVLQFNSVTDALSGGTRMFRAGSPIITLDNPFGGTALNTPINLYGVSENHRSIDVSQWSFDIQRELPLDSVLTIAYVGSKSTHAGDAYENWNDAAPSSNTNIQARRPFPYFYDPNYGGVRGLGSISFFDSYENTHYHGLQLSAEKRYGHGLTFGLNYTFSKTLGVGEGSGNSPSYIQEPLTNRDASKGRAQFDQTHAATAHFVYELPFGKGLHGVPAAFLKGWETNGILTLRSGLPYNVTGGDLNTGLSSYIRPDRIADGRLFEAASRQLWYDPSAFRRVTCNIPGRPDLCHYGDSGYNPLVSPGQRNLDFSAFKNFEIREGTRLQFRSEFFNATNTPFFGSPNGLSYTTTTSIVPDGPRVGEIRGLRTPMRIIQFALKLSF